MASTTATIASPKDFADAYLRDIGAPVTPLAEALVEAWQQTEGQWTASGSFNATSQHNPLNIESVPSSYSGATPTKITDSAGNSTLAFGSWADGVAAAAAFTQEYQPAIARALQQNNPGAFFAAVGGWNPGSSKYPQQILQNFASLQAGGSSWLSDVGNFLENGVTGQGAAILGAAGSGVLGGISGAASVLGEASHILGDLGNPSWWKRLGIGALGVALVVGGLILFVANTGEGKKIESAAPLAAI